MNPVEMKHLFTWPVSFRACGLHIQRINQICEDNYVVPGGDVRELIISNSLQTAIVDN